MPDLIQLLPDKIVNQIAAGEVIQRPASAVKELMENALDAGSSLIQLIVKDAGKTLIRVVDNGKGMSANDAKTCFQRHATSKIRGIDDLFALRTMGFRGEALASVAAIAQVELKTRRKEDKVGVHIRIEGSSIVEESACQTAPGTSISIKNLFYNVPARRSFLKSDGVETKHVIDEFLRIALAHPEVAFTFHHNNSEIYHLRESNSRQRAVAVFGHNYNERLVPVSEDTDYVKIEGFIGKPENAKRTRGEQFFFLNGRFIKNAYLNHAVTSAYGNLLTEKTFPLYVLHIDIDPKAIDVNVHPTKQEVKFEDEKLVYMIVQAAVKHGLAQYSVMPTIDFDQEASFKDFEAFRTNFSTATNQPAQTDRPAYTGRQNKPSAEAWQSLYEGSASEGNIVTVPSQWENQTELPVKDVESETSFIPVQLHKTYILTQIKSGIILVHQHLAHQRILFERYMDSFDQRSGSQQLLFPVVLHFNGSDTALVKTIIPDMRSIGFDIRESDDGLCRVNGVPADLVEENPEHILENMLEVYKWTAGNQKIGQRENLARSLARFAAIPAGRKMAPESMTSLIDQLFGCREPNVTPGAQPTYIRYSLENLREQFGVE
ncbi:MAG: DNA mismatch repair endonuclease MutL [Bacteroidetes bacterium]|nr:DNA mismatch repair endonuclease MutL [Bacteroidota bacterium]